MNSFVELHEQVSNLITATTELTETVKDAVPGIKVRLSSLEAYAESHQSLSQVASLPPDMGLFLVGEGVEWGARKLQLSDMPVGLNTGGGGTLNPNLAQIAGLTVTARAFLVGSSTGWTSRTLQAADLPENLASRVTALETSGTGTNWQPAIDGLQSQINNLAPANSGFFPGGDVATGDRGLGNRSNHALNFLTNNVVTASILANGAFNIWDGSGQRDHAVNGRMARGSLTIGNTDRNFGHGNGDNNNTASLLMECQSQTEMAVHDARNRVVSLLSYLGDNNYRVAIGRNMGWGTPNHIHLISRRISNLPLDGAPSGYLHVHGDGNVPNNFLKDEDHRPAIAATGKYPQLVLYSNHPNPGDNEQGAAIQMGGWGNRRWNIGISAKDSRYLDIGSSSGSDYSPHLGIRDAGFPTGFTLIAPGQSKNNSVGNAYAVGINQIEPEFNLEINGTFSFGVNRSRTEVKNDAGDNNSLVGKQSGFFYATPNNLGNFYSGVTNVHQHLIDCRRANDTSCAMQIAGADNDQRFFGRKTAGSMNRPWVEFLTQTSDFISNGWTVKGNKGTNASNDFIGTLDNADFVVRRNNIERLRFEESRTLIPNRTILGERNHINLHNPYGDWVGSPTLYVDRMEVGATDKASGQAAVLRIHQNGSGMCEFIKPQGQALILRETPGGGGAWFNLFTVQGRFSVESNTESTSTTTGSVTISGGMGVGGNLFVGNYIQARQEVRVNGIKVLGERGAGLTAANNSSIGATYSQAIADILNNMRTRIQELEDRLKQHGAIA